MLFIPYKLNKNTIIILISFLWFAFGYFKGSILLKKGRHFIIQGRFNKLIHGILQSQNVAPDSL